MAEITELGAWQILFWWLTGTLAVAVAYMTVGGQRRRQTADLTLAWWLWHWFTGGALEGDAHVAGARGQRHHPGTACRAARHPGRGTHHRSRRRRRRLVCARGRAPRHGTARGCRHGCVCRGSHPRGNARHRRRRAPCRRTTASGNAPSISPCTSCCGWDRDKRPLSYITVPRDRAETGVIVGYPPGFDLKDGHCGDVENMVRRKLDLGDVVSHLGRRRQTPVPDAPREGPDARDLLLPGPRHPGPRRRDPQVSPHGRCHDAAVSP